MKKLLRYFSSFFDFTVRIRKQSVVSNDTGTLLFFRFSEFFLFRSLDKSAKEEK